TRISQKFGDKLELRFSSSVYSTTGSAKNTETISKSFSKTRCIRHTFWQFVEQLLVEYQTIFAIQRFVFATSEYQGRIGYINFSVVPIGHRAMNHVEKIAQLSELKVGELELSQHVLKQFNAWLVVVHDKLQ